MSTESASLTFMQVSNLEAIEHAHLSQAVAVYQGAFERPPYSESFSEEEAQGALQFILDKEGDLVLGLDEGEVVSLAGGYFNEPGEYFVEELAVDPTKQGKGFGRATLQSLISIATDREADTLELCTHSDNVKAISLYQSEGFALDSVTKAALHRRTDGEIRFDTRVYLVKQDNGEREVGKEKQLKRLAVAYPSGNTTAVVFDQLLDEDREALNTKIMGAWEKQNPDSPEIEQCCFVTGPTNPDAVARVEMFGGEFCGNATRSVIQLLTEGKNYKGKIEVSGVDRPLDFSVHDGVIDLEMPLPAEQEVANSVNEGVLVNLDGITHLVVTDPTTQEAQTPRELLETLLQKDSYGLSSEPAVGVSYYNPETKQADFAVWVKEVKTIFDETACGSGTCSIGVAVATATESDTSMEVLQPSGEAIVTTARYDNEKRSVVSSRIAGTVRILSDGRFKLS